jgi:hypothetical protein
MIRMLPFWALFACAAASAQTGFPFASEELSYTVSWQTASGIGSVKTKASRDGDRWKLELTAEAGIPDFGVQDLFRSAAGADLCSAEFEKQGVHGKRKIAERTVFDAKLGLATRTTTSGGKSEIPIGPCARDAVAFLFFVRRELGQGRIPPPQGVLFGALYDLRLDYGGAQTVEQGGRKVETDRLLGTVHGPSSEHTFEVYFARDAARTPVRARIPLALGTITLDLVR